MNVEIEGYDLETKFVKLRIGTLFFLNDTIHIKCDIRSALPLEEKEPISLQVPEEQLVQKIIGRRVVINT